MMKPFWTAAVFLLSFQAFGNPSGKTDNCNICHSGGAEPTVSITGPSKIAAGSTNQAFTVTITGGAAQVAGFTVSSSNSQATLNPGAGQKKSGAALTHSAPKSFSGNSVSFDFTVNAPANAGQLTLSAFGNSANNDGRNSGDRAGSGSLTVTVEALVPNTDAGNDAGVDAGVVDAGIDGGPTTPTVDSGVADAGSNNNGAPQTPDESNPEPKGGCHAASGPLLGGWLALLVASTLRRRRA